MRLSIDFIRCSLVEFLIDLVQRRGLHGKAEISIDRSRGGGTCGHSQDTIIFVIVNASGFIPSIPMFLRKRDLRVPQTDFRFVDEFVAIAFEHLRPFIVESLVAKRPVGNVGNFGLNLR